MEDADKIVKKICEYSFYTNKSPKDWDFGNKCLEIN